MIQKLDNNNQEIASKIQALFQASYRVEAKLLEVESVKFPPLNRPLHDFVKSETEFYGIWKEDCIAAAIEIKCENTITEIHSLVVDPQYFRKGLGKQLMVFVLKNFESVIFTVETGLKNEPAKRLYEKLGFQEQKVWETPFGVMKIKYEKTGHNNA